MGSPWKGFVEFTLPASPPTAFVSADLSSTSPVGLSLSPYGRSSLQMSFDPGMLHNNGHTAYANGSGPGIRETGVVEKLLTSYGFIQCSERQARLFFHCSQYNGNLQELKIGDDVEFEVSSDRRTGKPIAVKLLKIKPEVLPEERISGQVGPDLHAYPFTVLHGYIHPVKSTVLFLVVICLSALLRKSVVFLFPLSTNIWVTFFFPPLRLLNLNFSLFVILL
ncbi:uncharacterized protein LOC106943772 isoform X2 [Poecilia latipinna]|uniref:uncharacterized protein LOC106943772 isoform X2 n=1 Tax=Poecilia latipinna TaxID=48699 RepID=UPI00072DE1AC|nr:PREDICTED: uncharacterized protein LOC106943772 isoform X2 [Poecilia latipinna]